MFVTDEEYASALIESLLTREGYEVAIVDTFEKALELLANKTFGAVFIRETIEGKREQFVDAVRKTSPRTVAQVYSSASSLLLHDEAFGIAEEILTGNLNLFTSLLSSKENLPHNHSATVGRYVGKLCRKLGLSPRDRMLVVMAAYMHDVARYYYPDSSADYKTVIESTRRLLSSFDYSAAILNMLSSMYRNLKGGDHISTSLETLGGNIITIVDLFCENIVFDRDFTLDKFDATKKRLRDFVGKLFFAEVVEAFIGLIQEEILNLHTGGITGKIELFANDPRVSYPLVLRLKNEGFQVTVAGTVAELAAARGICDLFMLYLRGDYEAVEKSINEITECGVDFKLTPTILMTDTDVISKLGWLYEKGIEDILSEELNHDTLILKLRKMLTRLFQNFPQSPSESQSPGSSGPIGAKGRLADMNLVDLMQALGPGRRTVKITVHPSQMSSDVSDRAEKLMIFLDKGNITHAAQGSLTGAEAVYEGMTWTDGAWTIEPITTEDLPSPNVSLANDAILMEGAYRLDEKMRGGKL
jgi:DNA-binding response OmpR family regulator